MDPHGDCHRSDECELDHECDQEIQEAIQQVPQQVIHPETNGYELDHESGQEVAQQTNQKQDNRSELVHGLDEIESQWSSEDKGSYGSIQMKIQMISTTRHYRGYTLPFNFRALDWKFRYLKRTRKFLHRRIVTATVAVIDDAEIVDLPIEELFLPRTSTPLPQNALIPDIWSMVTREVAGDPCFFILRSSQFQKGTAMLNCNSPEHHERLARSSQSTESLEGESSTSFAAQALVNFDIDIIIVPENLLWILIRIGHWDKIRKLCVVVPKDSSNRLSPLTMRRLNRLSALDNLTIFVTNSEHAQRPIPKVDFVRYTHGIKRYIESRTSLQRVNPIQEFFRLLCDLVIVVSLAIISCLVSFF